MKKEVSNNHHRATNPLKADGLRKNGEKGETEGDRDSCQSVTLSVLVTGPPYLSISSLSRSVFLPIVYEVAPYMPLENNVTSAGGLYVCLNY